MKELIVNIRYLSADIYSWCDIVNGLLINLFRNDIRYRGTSLSNSFNVNFKKIYKASRQKGILKGVHSKSDLKLFYYDSRNWFIKIRTRETHYGVGKVSKLEGKGTYSNNNINGVSKTLYSNPSEEIFITVEDFMYLIDHFLDYQDHLCNIVSKLLSKKD